MQTTVAAIRASLEAGRLDFDALLREAILCAREAVIAEAVQAGAAPSSYASTLLALLITPAGGAAAQIGDGVIVLRSSRDPTGFHLPQEDPARSGIDETIDDAPGDWHYVTWPQHGEYINTTYFLTRDDAPDRLEVTALDGSVTDFALTTDGLEALVLHYDTRTVHAPFFDAMFRPLAATDDPAVGDRLSAALGAFLASDRIASRTDDDVTLLLATRRRSAPDRSPDLPT